MSLLKGTPEWEERTSHHPRGTCQRATSQGGLPQLAPNHAIPIEWKATVMQEDAPNYAACHHHQERTPLENGS